MHRCGETLHKRENSPEISLACRSECPHEERGEKIGPYTKGSFSGHFINQRYKNRLPLGNKDVTIL